MIKKIFTSALLPAVILFACKLDDKYDFTNSADQLFMRSAALFNSAVLQMAVLANSKAVNPAVLAFAQTQVAQKTNLFTQLKNISGHLPNPYRIKDSINSDQKKIIAHLETLGSTAFDSAYIYIQIDFHDKLQTIFTRENEGRNPELRAFAAANLPLLNMQRASADSIANAFFKR